MDRCRGSRRSGVRAVHSDSRMRDALESGTDMAAAARTITIALDHMATTPGTSLDSFSSSAIAATTRPQARRMEALIGVRRSRALRTATTRRTSSESCSSSALPATTPPRRAHMASRIAARGSLASRTATTRKTSSGNSSWCANPVGSSPVAGVRARQQHATVITPRTFSERRSSSAIVASPLVVYGRVEVVSAAAVEREP
jgi:hypothetical protein